MYRTLWVIVTANVENWCERLSSLFSWNLCGGNRREYIRGGYGVTVCEVDAVDEIWFDKCVENVTPKIVARCTRWFHLCLFPFVAVHFGPKPQ
jgi:hypothetical protein